MRASPPSVLPMARPIACSSTPSCTQQRAKASIGSTSCTGVPLACIGVPPPCIGVPPACTSARQRATSAASSSADRGAPSWFSSTITGLPTHDSNSSSGCT
jgi:hypothetical protein